MGSYVDDYRIPDFNLPNWDEIAREVLLAKNDALVDTFRLGIVLENEEWLKIGIPNIVPCEEEFDDLGIAEEAEVEVEAVGTSPPCNHETADDEAADEVKDDLHVLSCIKKDAHLQFKDLSTVVQSKPSMDEYLANSPYVKMKCSLREIIIKKQLYVGFWTQKQKELVLID